MTKKEYATWMMDLKYSVWARKLNKLNKKINSLKVWDDYAEMLQSSYDSLLRENPTHTKELLITAGAIFEEILILEQAMKELCIQI